jgi:hypothetical protein
MMMLLWGLGGYVRARETRRKVLIRARMRSGRGWHDVTIRNISSRGMLVQTAAGQGRGSYVEIRRGRHVIVGRVVWTSGNNFGLHTQDPVAVNDVIAEPDMSSTSYAKASKAQPSYERRSAYRHTERTRLDDRADRSRRLARVGEFASTAALAALLVGFAGTAAASALSKPMATITLAFSEAGTPP